MQKKLATELVAYGYGNLQLHDDYCGRGMAKSTFAISGSMSDFLEAVGTMMLEYCEAASTLDPTSKGELEQFNSEMQELDPAGGLGALRFDNLMDDVIIY